MILNRACQMVYYVHIFRKIICIANWLSQKVSSLYIYTLLYRHMPSVMQTILLKQFIEFLWSNIVPCLENNANMWSNGDATCAKVDQQTCLFCHLIGDSVEVCSLHKIKLLKCSNGFKIMTFKARDHLQIGI